MGFGMRASVSGKVNALFDDKFGDLIYSDIYYIRKDPEKINASQSQLNYPKLALNLAFQVRHRWAKR